jgi:hypothetical protein
MSASDRDTSFSEWLVAVGTETFRRSKDTETKLAWGARLLIAAGVVLVPNVLAAFSETRVPIVLRVVPVIAYRDVRVRECAYGEEGEGKDYKEAVSARNASVVEDQEVRIWMVLIPSKSPVTRCALLPKLIGAE